MDIFKFEKLWHGMSWKSQLRAWTNANLSFLFSFSQELHYLRAFIWKHIWISHKLSCCYCHRAVLLYSLHRCPAFSVGLQWYTLLAIYPCSSASRVIWRTLYCDFHIQSDTLKDLLHLIIMSYKCLLNIKPHANTEKHSWISITLERKLDVI